MREVIISQERRTVVESDIPTLNVKVSISDMKISQQTEIRNVRFTEESKLVQTRVIVREEEESPEDSLDEAELKQRK